MKSTLVGVFWGRKLEEDYEKAAENEDYLRYYIIKHDKVFKSVKYSHAPYGQHFARMPGCHEILYKKIIVDDGAHV